jgi:predicted kinase
VEIPPYAIVLLIGPAGSGKSTFAKEHFPPEAIVSSDQLRKTAPLTGKKRRVDVFETMLQVVESRMRQGILTVVDATNTEWMRRSSLIGLAKQHGRRVIAIVFNLPLEECLARNHGRPDAVPASVIRRQHAQLQQDLDRFDLEGFSDVHYIDVRQDQPHV